jgi:hypothetical protein
MGKDREEVVGVPGFFLDGNQGRGVEAAPTSSAPTKRFGRA